MYSLISYNNLDKTELTNKICSANLLVSDNFVTKYRSKPKTPKMGKGTGQVWIII